MLFNVVRFTITWREKKERNSFYSSGIYHSLYTCIYYSTWAGQSCPWRHVLLSQGCIFGQVNVYSSWQLICLKLANITTAAQGNNFFVLQWKGQFFQGLTRRATAPVPYSCSISTNSQRVTQIFEFYLSSYSRLTWCVEPCTAGQTLLLPGS